MRLLVILFALMLAPLAATAQNKHGHSHAAPNGGQIQQIGPYEAELVVKGGKLFLYVVDEKENKVDASKLTASAMVLAKDGQKPVELKPAGGNMLVAESLPATDGKLRATLTLSENGKELGKGRYNLDRK